MERMESGNLQAYILIDYSAGIREPVVLVETTSCNMSDVVPETRQHERECRSG